MLGDVAREAVTRLETTGTTYPETGIDLVSPEVVADPHALFAQLREGGEVWWLRRHKAWLLLGYDDVITALDDEGLSTDTITPLQRHMSTEERERFKPARDLLAGWMIFNDPAMHTALRAPVRRAFTPRSVSRLETDIAELTDRLLDGLDPAGFDFVELDPAGFDFVEQFAHPLPAVVIAYLLGVPDERHEDFKTWSKQLGALVMGKVSRADAWDRALTATHDLDELFSEMIAKVRREPGEDLITTLVGGSEDHGELTDNQLVGACSMLLFGGHETSTSLLTNSTRHLLDRPDRQEQVRADPAAAVEEILRFDGPSKIVVRRVREDGDRFGVPMRAGQPMFLANAAANRDPEAFDRPDELVLDRDPNRHLGFGWGMHFCLGSQLARLEARVVLPKLVDRFPGLRLAVDPDELRYYPTIVGRTLKSLPLRAD